MDEKIDIWAIGVIAYYLLSFENFPFPGTEKTLVNARILTGQPEPTKIQHCSDQAKEFLNSCFTIDPLNRPSAADLLKKDWLAQMIPVETAEDAVILANSRDFAHVEPFRKPICSLISNILMKSASVKKIADEFHKVDENHDGLISRQEFRKAM